MGADKVSSLHPSKSRGVRVEAEEESHLDLAPHFWRFPVKIEDYGTDAYPIRMSSLTSLQRCPAMSLIGDARLDLSERRSGRAAQTGTAVGRIIELWHAGRAMQDAVRQTTLEAQGQVDKRSALPQADLKKAETWAVGYAEDPRNPQDGVLACSLEREVRLELEPDPEDPTGKPILLVGHTDQVRRNNFGRLELWDVKSGSPGGAQMLAEYAWQLCAYSLACTESYGEAVVPGGVIRVRDYTARRIDLMEGVFYHAAYTLDDARSMMRGVAHHVAMIRKGIVHQHPGVHCLYCPAQGPHLCGRLLEPLDEDWNLG